MGVNFIVFCLAAVNGFHVEGMAEDEGDALIGAQIRDPVPGEHAFHGDDEILPIRGYDAEKDCTIGFYVSVQPYFSGFIKDADIHFFGMKVDSAIKFVLFGVKSHMASSFGLKCLLIQEAFYHASGGGLK